MLSWLRVYKKDPKISENEGFFLRNGGLLLEKLINSCDGKSNPIRVFSAETLQKATTNYAPNQILHEEGIYYLYKGTHESRMITVTKFEKWDHDDLMEFSIREVVIASQMKHGNVLKLLGCCLETQFPIPVYEFASNGNLSHYIYEEEGENRSGNRLLLPWESRLRIATEIADALAYLHIAFSEIIIHRDVKPRNILLDKNWVAKLSDFTLSVSIPLGETHMKVDGLSGTFGYLDPNYSKSNIVTEKVDVYSFGILLLELLTGRKVLGMTSPDSGERIHVRDYVIPFAEKNCLGEVVTPTILEGGVDQLQLQASIELALKCTDEIDDERPTMMDVAKQLRQIRRTRSSPLGT